MNKFFDLNSPFMMFLGRMADLVIVSFWWFVCCIPVITTGPSFTALYYVTLKIARKEDVRVTASFFKAFKENFSQAAILGSIFLALGAVLIYNYIWASAGASTFLVAIYFSLLIWTLCTMFYTYPLQAQFYNTVKQTLINAMILASRKFLITIVVFALNIFPAIVALFFTPIFVQTLPVWLLLTPGLIAFVCSLFFVRIFDPLIEEATGKKPGEEDEEE